MFGLNLSQWMAAEEEGERRRRRSSNATLPPKLTKQATTLSLLEDAQDADQEATSAEKAPEAGSRKVSFDSERRRPSIFPPPADEPEEAGKIKPPSVELKPM